jgi:hypothetical protein
MEKMPVFVKINQPEDMESSMSSLKEKLGEIKEILAQVQSFSDDEKAKIDEWKSNFELVNKKINDVSNYLLEPEGL